MLLENSSIGAAGSQPSPRSGGVSESVKTFGGRVASVASGAASLVGGAASSVVGGVKNLGSYMVSVPENVGNFFSNLLGGVSQSLDETSSVVIDATQDIGVLMTEDEQGVSSEAKPKKDVSFVNVESHLDQVTKLAEKLMAMRVDSLSSGDAVYQKIGTQMEEAQATLASARKAFNEQKAKMELLATNPKNAAATKRAKDGLHNMEAALIKMEKGLVALGKDCADYTKAHKATKKAHGDKPLARTESATLERGIRGLQRDMEHYLTGFNKVMSAVNVNESIGDKFASRETWATIKAFVASATGVAGIVGAIALLVAAAVGTGGMALVAGAGAAAFISAGIGLAALYKAYKEGGKAIEAGALKRVDNSESSALGSKYGAQKILGQLEHIVHQCDIYAEAQVDVSGLRNRLFPSVDAEASGISTGDTNILNQCDQYARSLLLMSPETCYGHIKANVSLENSVELNTWSTVLQMMMENDPTATLERVQHWPMATTAAILGAAANSSAIPENSQPYKNAYYTAGQILSSWAPNAPHTVAAILHHMGGTGIQATTTDARIAADNKLKTPEQKFVQHVLDEMVKSLGADRVNKITQQLNDGLISATLVKMDPRQAAAQLMDMADDVARYDAIRGMPVRNAAAILTAMVGMGDTGVPAATYLLAQCQIRPGALLAEVVKQSGGVEAAQAMVATYFKKFGGSVEENDVFIKAFQKIEAEDAAKILNGVEHTVVIDVLANLQSARDNEIAKRREAGFLGSIQNLFTSAPAPISDILSAMKPDKAFSLLVENNNSTTAAQWLEGMRVGDLGKIMSSSNYLTPLDIDKLKGALNALREANPKEGHLNLNRMMSYAHIFNGLAVKSETLPAACNLLKAIWEEEGVDTRKRDNRIRNAFHEMDFGTRLNVLRNLHTSDKTEDKALASNVLDVLLPGEDFANLRHIMNQYVSEGGKTDKVEAYIRANWNALTSAAGKADQKLQDTFGVRIADVSKKAFQASDQLLTGGAISSFFASLGKGDGKKESAVDSTDGDAVDGQKTVRSQRSSSMPSIPAQPDGKKESVNRSQRSNSVPSFDGGSRNPIDSAKLNFDFQSGVSRDDAVSSVDFQINASADDVYRLEGMNDYLAEQSQGQTLPPPYDPNAAVSVKVSPGFDVPPPPYTSSSFPATNRASVGQAQERGTVMFTPLSVGLSSEYKSVMQAWDNLVKCDYSQALADGKSSPLAQFKAAMNNWKPIATGEIQRKENYLNQSLQFLMYHRVTDVYLREKGNNIWKDYGSKINEIITANNLNDSLNPLNVTDATKDKFETIGKNFRTNVGARYIGEDLDRLVQDVLTSAGFNAKTNREAVNTLGNISIGQAVVNFAMQQPGYQSTAVAE